MADDDSLREFVVDSNERRDISKGQRAMAYAIVFPQPRSARERGAMGGKGNKAPAATAGAFGETLLKQARAVLATIPDYAAQVRDGFPLEEAFALADRGAPKARIFPGGFSPRICWRLRGFRGD